jgi:signal peptidase I
MSSWRSEEEFRKRHGMTHNVSRLMNESDYPALEAAGRAAGYRDLGLPVPSSLQTLARQASSIMYPDFLAHEKSRLEVLRGAFPQESRYSYLLARHNMGYYVPESRILPLGDNRDNSNDGRYFGPVKKSKILGRGSFIYIPGEIAARGLGAFRRFGFIR